MGSGIEGLLNLARSGVEFLNSSIPEFLDHLKKEK
jgi:hypothetical protein